VAVTDNEDWREYWKLRDAWTVREFAQLCCGWNPTDYTFPDQTQYNEARDSINRAVRVRALATIDDLAWPKTGAEVMYDEVPAFRPFEVAAWAARKYPRTFPFAGDNVPSSSPLESTKVPKRLAQLWELSQQIPAGESQKGIAHRIQQALAVSARDAQAYASLIRPDAAVEQDRRAGRRRTT